MSPPLIASSRKLKGLNHDYVMLIYGCFIVCAIITESHRYGPFIFVTYLTFATAVIKQLHLTIHLTFVFIKWWREIKDKNFL
jgi:hypothetical protein